MRTENFIKFYFIILISFLFIRCSDETNPVNEIVENSDYYIVINEGLYGQNNSSVTMYDIRKRQAIQNVYANANGGNDLGDTANDFAQCCGKGFIVLDKSKKIEIIDLQNFKSLGFIDFNDYGSPRNIAVYDTTRAYVSTLNNSVVEFNTQTYEVTKTFAVGELPEGLAICDNKLFVANSGFGTGNSVSVVDLQTENVTAEIEVKINPRFVETDGDYVYVISPGEYTLPGEGAITKIDANSLAPVDTVTLTGNPTKATIANGNLYVIYGSGVAEISLESFEISDSLFIDGNEVNSLTGVIYSIFYDNSQMRFVLGNPKDFMQNGEVVIFDVTGTKLDKFDCGLNPGTISLVNIK